MQSSPKFWSNYKYDYTESTHIKPGVVYNPRLFHYIPSNIPQSYDCGRTLDPALVYVGNQQIQQQQWVFNSNRF